MENESAHEIELYSPESFEILFDHEVNRSRRSGNPMTLLDITFETKPANPESQHSAEVYTINALNLRLRDTDIPCKKDSEFLVLMPATDEQGARIACERLENLFKVKHQTYDRVSFELIAYLGMATLPGDRSISSKELMKEAAVAMRQARAKHLTNTVIFSEMEHE